jgi:hypothetical protein
VVVRLPHLVVHEVAGEDLGFISMPPLVAVGKENESGFDVLLLDIYFVLTHVLRASDACKDNSTLC